ncbi:MAG: hypothetical protein ACE5G8_01405, partial [Anaerolineae bacterium]
MLKRKSPIAAIGLATGAMVLQPVWPAVQKFWQAINLSMANLPTLQTAWPAAQRFVSVELQAIWPVVQKSLENGYWHLSVANSWNYIVILAAVILEGPIATLL